MAETSSSENAPSTAEEVRFFSSALTMFSMRPGASFTVICTTLNSAQPIRAAVKPPKPPRRIVVLDSSFNPPTVAHMQMGTSAIKELYEGPQVTTRLLLLLSASNADKAMKPAVLEDRLAMMFQMSRDMQDVFHKELPPQAEVPIDVAVINEPYFSSKSKEIAEAELYRGTTSDDSTAPEKQTEQVFLVGFDTLIRVFDPKYYKTPDQGLAPNQTPMQAALSPFLRRARLRVTTRPDDEWGSEDKQEEWLQSVHKLSGSEDWVSRIELTPSPFRGKDVVSSTMARRAAKQRNTKQLAKLVSPNVLAHIKYRELYGE